MMIPYAGPAVVILMLAYGFTMLFATVSKEDGRPAAFRVVGSIVTLLVGAIVLGVLGWNASF